MRHSHFLSHKEWSLAMLNGVSRSHRSGGRGRHRAKSLEAVWGAERYAREHDATELEIQHALDCPTRLRF